MSWFFSAREHPWRAGLVLSACGEAHVSQMPQWQLSLGWHRADEPISVPTSSLWHRHKVLSSHTVLLVGISVSSPQAELCCEPLSG